jgi:hypothetical protein
MFKIDYFIFKYFLTSKIAVLHKKMSNGSPLLNRILFFPKNKLLSVMSNCSTNCEPTIAAQFLGNGGKIEPYTIIMMIMITCYCNYQNIHF